MVCRHYWRVESGDTVGSPLGVWIGEQVIYFRLNISVIITLLSFIVKTNLQRDVHAVSALAVK